MHRGTAPKEDTMSEVTTTTIKTTTATTSTAKAPKFNKAAAVALVMDQLADYNTNTKKVDFTSITVNGRRAIIIYYTAKGVYALRKNHEGEARQADEEFKNQQALTYHAEDFHNLYYGTDVNAMIGAIKEEVAAAVKRVAEAEAAKKAAAEKKAAEKKAEAEAKKKSAEKKAASKKAAPKKVAKAEAEKK